MKHSTPLYLLLLLATTACGDAQETNRSSEESDEQPQNNAVLPENNAAQPENNNTAQDPTPDEDNPEPPSALVAGCSYTNPFSNSAECKQYSGGAWTSATAQEDCAAALGGPGTFSEGQLCPAGPLGRCLVGDPDAEGYELYFAGDDAQVCATAQLGCETFARGRFEPGSLCQGEVPDQDEPGGPPLLGVFLPPTQTCTLAQEGEPSGASDGEVCTWNAISACTEPGRKFSDYASCDVVRTQRPYYPRAPERTSQPDDPRLQDPTFQQELAWITAQIDACACVCCHTESLTPNGASLWDTEAGPIWTDTIPDTGVAMMAGLVDSTVFGAFPARDNNGFDRSQTGAPTTDIARMRAFFEREYLRRGNTAEQADAIPPFGGPLVDQYYFEPEACRAGQGVDAQGRVWWSGAKARYVYVLEEGSDNPGVPPNLDLPEGTLWRLDVSPSSTPLTSGVLYGAVPEGTLQAFPVEGEPPPLEDGRTYYLYAMIDVGLPIARCLFTYPVER